MSFLTLRNYMMGKYPYLLSGHFKQGYIKTYTQELATENLLLFKSITDKYDLRYWLSFGTLLGVYRDGELISYDCDIDISIRYDDAENFVKADPELLENGFEPIRMDKNYPLISWGRKGQYIDLYGFYKVSDCEYRLASYKLESEQVENLSVINFKGVDFQAPLDIEKYLVRYYGDTWQTPIVGKPAKGD